jgi:hypothetical protein
MNRLPDWRVRLHETVESSRRVEFRWGVTDCAIWAADVVRALTGEDIAAAFRSAYTDAKGARRALKKAGFSDLADMAASYLEEIPIMLARDGDLAAIPAEDFGHALGVVVGERVMVRHPSGIGSIDRAEAVKAFRIP